MFSDRRYGPTCYHQLLQALIGMHRPGDAAELEAAKRRMAFEELLLLQLKLLLRREIDRTPRSEVDLVGTRISKLDMMQAGRDALGFRLTDAQDRVLTEVGCCQARGIKAQPLTLQQLSRHCALCRQMV